MEACRPQRVTMVKVHVAQTTAVLYEMSRLGVASSRFNRAVRAAWMTSTDRGLLVDIFRAAPLSAARYAAVAFFDAEESVAACRAEVASVNLLRTPLG